MNSLSQEIARFVVETEFEDLPEAVVHEAKRVLLDSIGCALAGTTVDKGAISIQLARRLGGPPESSIIGTSDRVSCSNAAFANGELINAIDYDAQIHPPSNVATYVIPGPLAVAESVGASGKDLILATVLGHEISTRIARALSGHSGAVHGQPEKGRTKWPSTYGYGQCIFGGTAGVGKILKLDSRKMCHALGIAGHISPVPTERKWLESVPSAMTKYGSGGWISTAEVIAAMLAEMGYVGDSTVFDGEYGFWRFFASDRWEPEVVMDKIGETWLCLEMQYKPYPCCRVMHGALDCFTSIISKNNLAPEDIESVRAFCTPLVEAPLLRSTEIATHVDASFSAAYVFATAAHRVRAGADWQDLDTRQNPKILEFMKKISCQVVPGYEEIVRRDPRSRYCGIVEVVAKGKTFREERMYAKGVPFTNARTTDEELVEKFRQNASRILTQDRIEGTVKSLLELETVENILQLLKQVTL